MYAKETLEGMSRKELQKLCKEAKIKANKKNCELIEELYTFFLKEEKAMLAIEIQLKETERQVVTDADEHTEHQADIKVADRTYSVITCESPVIGPVQSSVIEPVPSSVIEPVKSSAIIPSSIQTADSDESLKETILKELEQRAAARVIEAEKITSKPTATCGGFANKKGGKLIDFAAAHAREFSKMDSIDVYLAKKRKGLDNTRSEILDEAKSAAESACQAVKKMKLTHNTPVADKSLVSKLAVEDQRKKTNNSKRLSFKSPAFRPTVLHVDASNGFNFVSKLKSPKKVRRTSPRLSEGQKTVSALSGKGKSGVRTSPRVAVLCDKTNVPATDNHAPKKTTPSGVRKSVHFTSVRRSTGSNAGKRLTMSDLSSSFAKASKFDLQASLKKGLTYTPHKGKLQPFQDTTIASGNGSSQPRLGLKDIKGVALREKRREDNKAHKKSRKFSDISRRRGMQC